MILIILSSCNVNVEVENAYYKYFDESTLATFQQGMTAYQNAVYQLADSLFTIVISISKDKLDMNMPMETNPYYYRGHSRVEIEKYEQAISDFENCASDTTTNTDILLARTEAFKMLSQYDTAIVLCNRLLDLRYDSLIVLSQRGLCYYQKKDMQNACADLTKVKELSNDTFLDKFLKDCK